MKVSIVGTGYVGLVSGACLAELGHHVTCVDVVEAKVKSLQAGQCPIHEEALPEIIEKTAGKTLFATMDMTRAIHESDLTLIAGPTPFDGKQIDLRFIREIAASIGKALKTKNGYHVVVVKSTVVPGTTDDVVLPILEAESGKKAGRDFGVGMNPEFLSEGVAVKDFKNPDRLVYGGIDDRTRDALAELYKSFAHTPTVRTNNRTAEMIKYASNSLQATLISFSNEMARVCETHPNLDIKEVLRGVHLMNEITPVDPTQPGTRKTAPISRFIGAGCGFGGSCFPKDVSALIAHGQQRGQAMPLLSSVMQINQSQPLKLVEFAEQSLGNLSKKNVTVLGLAFKPGTDDVRESPAHPIIAALLHRGAAVTVFDPIVQSLAGNSSVRFAKNLGDAVSGADAILLVTNWPEFADVPRMIKTSGKPVILCDGRRMFAPDSADHYMGIGLKSGNEGRL